VTVAAIFLPLIAAIIAGFFGRWIGDRGAQLVTCAAVLASAVLAIFIFFQVAIGGADTDAPIDITIGNLDVVGSGAGTNADGNPIGNASQLTFATDGAIDVAPLLSHMLPIEKVDEAFRIARDRTDNALKVSIKF